MEETYVFALDTPTIKHNMKAGRDLVGSLGAPDVVESGRQPYRWSGVQPEKIIDFISEYRARQATLISQLLVEYISAQQPQDYLTDWTVVLTTGEGDTKATFDINGNKVDVPTLVRTEADDQDCDYKLKNARILSPGHEALDLSVDEFAEALELTRSKQKPGAKPTGRPSGVFVRKARPRRRGLLLLYPLDPIGCSRAKAGQPILGYAISFPVLNNDQKVTYLVVEHFFKYPELGLGLDEEEETEE